MTAGRTTPTPHRQLRSPLRVLDGGLTHDRLQDDTVDRAARVRLSEEIAEAARLCDRLEDQGLRIAFELGGPERVRVSVKDLRGAPIDELGEDEADHVMRLMELSGIGG
ncbi:MAG: hypothetical protein AAGC46_02680 [Solirubrobacteraceae bacterium]|nr:hypothetical protein [Patulibacter sp.]